MTPGGMAPGKRHRSPRSTGLQMAESRTLHRYAHGSDPDDPAGAMGGEIVCRTCGMLKPLVEQRTAEPPQHSSGRRYWDANRTVHSWGVLRKTLIGRRGVVVLDRKSTRLNSSH